MLLTEPLSTGAVVLAAGASSRLGQPKQLLRLGGLSLLERTVQAALAGGCQPVVVIVPPDLTLPPLSGTTLVINTRRGEGQASSLRLGIQYLDGRAVDAALVLVCDQPGIDAGVVKRLREAAQRHPAPITASAYPGGPGVPAVFRRSLFAELQRLQGDIGARQLFARFPPVTVDFPDGRWDIDTPGDLERWQAEARRQDADHATRRQARRSE